MNFGERHNSVHSNIFISPTLNSLLHNSVCFVLIKQLFFQVVLSPALPLNAIKLYEQRSPCALVALGKVKGLNIYCRHALSLRCGQQEPITGHLTVCFRFYSYRDGGLWVRNIPCLGLPTLFHPFNSVRAAPCRAGSLCRLVDTQLTREQKPLCSQHPPTRINAPMPSTDLRVRYDLATGQQKEQCHQLT